MSKIFGGGGDGGAGAAIAKQTEQVKKQQTALDVKVKYIFKVFHSTKIIKVLIKLVIS